MPKEINKLIETRIDGIYQMVSRKIETVSSKIDKKLEDLNTKFKELEEKTDNQSSNKEGIAEITAEFNKYKLEILGTIKQLSGESQYDLKKVIPGVEQFKYIFAESKLEVDYQGKAPTAKLLNKLFKKFFKPDANKNPTGCTDYPFGPRTLNDKYTIEQWITGDTAKNLQSKDKSGKGVGNIYDNRFDTSNPQEKKVMLGTGTGKSTLFLRCVAHGGKSNKKPGVTLVVPYSSLIKSVLIAHNYWLSLGKDTKKDKDGKIVLDLENRVTVCPICKGHHTAEFDREGNPVIDKTTLEQIGKYETVHNGPSKMINVFTWWEFLDAWVNDKKDKDGNKWIKDWVIYDEAHSDLPCFRILIDKLKEKPNIRNFKMVEMSATFSDIPTSRYLSGIITDRWITNFDKIFAENPKMFERKNIIFIDKPNKDDNGETITWEKFLPDLKELQSECKVLILNDAIKDYATDIVQSMEPPLLVIASRDYSVGFSFGDVNVISTGVAKRKIVTVKDGKWVYSEIPVTSTFDDLLQERGRAAREELFIAVWLAFIEKGKSFSLIDKDETATLLKRELTKGKITPELKKLTEDLVNFYSKPELLPPIDPEDAKRYLNLILVNFLKKKLENPAKLFELTVNEKKKSGGKIEKNVVFENKLLRLFEKDQIFDKEHVLNILIKATEEKKKSIDSQYDWSFTSEREDDCVYNEQDAKIVGFLLHVREEGRGYELEIETVELKDKNKKEVISRLIFTFKPYKLEKKLLLL